MQREIRSVCGSITSWIDDAFRAMSANHQRSLGGLISVSEPRVRQVLQVGEGITEAIVQEPIFFMQTMLDCIGEARIKQFIAFIVAKPSRVC